MGKSLQFPGFRFKPTDVELAMYYLKKKLLGKKLDPEVIAEINIYDFSPWDLPAKSILCGDLEWYFFCSQSKKYSSGARMNRATETGYWKGTGKDKEVKYKGRTVAMMKILVFHLGHPPKGTRTNWVMHEYRMKDNDLANQGVAQEAYVICKVFEKSGVGPQNGAQYGAPFEEEDWDDDDDDNVVTSLALVNSNDGSGSTGVMNMTSTEPSPSTNTLDPNASTLALVNSNDGSDSTGVMNMTSTKPSPSTNTFDPNASTLALVNSNDGSGSTGVMNMTSTESGPSTNTFDPNASTSGLSPITSWENGKLANIPDNDDDMLTHGDLALMLRNNDVQEVEDPKKKKLMADDGINIFKELGGMSNFDDLGEDAFNMFGIDGSVDDDSLELDALFPDDFLDWV